MQAKNVCILFLAAFLMLIPGLNAQEISPEEENTYLPLVLKLNSSGTNYIRFLLWHQQWVVTNNLKEPGNFQVSTLIRRSRVLAVSELGGRILILTHFGLNGLTSDNLTSLGNDGNAAQLFLHDAWVEFKVIPQLYIGGGLHYWKGLTRMSNESTLNFMTLDNTRPFVHWHSLAVTDQFARHLGLYLKGAIGKFDYRLAWNNPGRNGLQADRATNPVDSMVYNGFAVKDADGNSVGNSIVEGYFRYNIWDKESTKLPYSVGTYLGSKRVLAIGAGFFAHPKGMFNYKDNDQNSGEHQGVFHIGLDAFLDTPVGAPGNGTCLNVYASYMRFDYGEHYVSRWAGTGDVLYGQVGFKLFKLPLMPYVAYQWANYEGFDDPVGAFNAGINYFIKGHQAKLTLEYHSIANDPRESPLGPDGKPIGFQQIRFQAHIFL